MGRSSRVFLSYSQFLLILGMLLIACGSANTTTPQFAPNGYTKTNKSCSETECLFKSDQSQEPPLGIATLKGFYHAQETNFALGPQPTPIIEVCDEFVIINAPQALNQWFQGLIELGNTVNRITEDNQLALSIYVNELSSDEQTSIRQSTKATPIELLILIPTPPARGPVQRCITWVEILKIKPIR